MKADVMNLFILRHGKEIFFFAMLVLCAMPVVSPPLALAIGLLLGLTIGHPWEKFYSKLTRILLQVAVVCLGFSMNLGEIMEVGRQGLILTAMTILGTIVAGYFIGRFFKVEQVTCILVASGTAICGGSAIAAVGSAIKADGRQMAGALGTVFVLNAVALFVFPCIGRYLGLSQEQFGEWAAVAIHDTSSVVGATAKYGQQALQTGIVIKLARTLWIIPMVFVISAIACRRISKVHLPLFIVWFLLAAVVRTFVPGVHGLCQFLAASGKQGLTLALFLIGAGITRETLFSVGLRPLTQGVVLWFLVSVVTLLIIFTKCV